MEYLIDGYNLIFRLQLDNLSLEKRREKILLFLEQENAYLNWSIKVIFDGEHWQETLPEVRQHGSLNVIYTPKSQTADEYIAQEIEYSFRPRSITVVTSDKTLAYLCRSLDAHSMTIEAFLKKLQSRAEKRLRRKEEDKKFPEELPFNLKRLQEIFEKKLREESKD